MDFRPVTAADRSSDARAEAAEDDSLEFIEFEVVPDEPVADEDSDDLIPFAAAENAPAIEEMTEATTSSAPRPSWLKSKAATNAESAAVAVPSLSSQELSSRERAAAAAGTNNPPPRTERVSTRHAAAFSPVPKIKIDEHDPLRFRIAGSLLLAEIVERAGRLVGLELQVGDEVVGRSAARESSLKLLTREFVFSEEARGYVISLTLHALILLALSLVIANSFDENEPVSTIITETEAIDVNLTEIVALEMARAGSEEMTAPQLQKIPLQNADPFLSSDLASNFAAMGGDGEGGGENETGGFVFQMPTGGKAVQKGSFTAWTVPADPKPREDYIIVIRIKLPDSSRTYNVSDLSGKVIGTDSYEQEIPYDRRKPDAVLAEKGGRLVPVKLSDRLRVIENHVQLMVRVQGAASLVEDTIVVGSKRLKEEQNLKIVF